MRRSRKIGGYFEANQIQIGEKEGAQAEDLGKHIHEQRLLLHDWRRFSSGDSGSPTRCRPLNRRSFRPGARSFVPPRRQRSGGRRRHTGCRLPKVRNEIESEESSQRALELQCDWIELSQE